MITYQSAKIFYVLLIVIVFLFPGCSRLEKARQHQTLKNIVRVYNNLLIEVNKTRDLTPLKEIAHQNVIKKLHLWMAAWQGGNFYLDAELKDLEFVHFAIAGQEAVATTEESWSYRYRDLDTQEIAKPSTSISYTMEYRLEKREGHWLIAQINILQET